LKSASQLPRPARFGETGRLPTGIVAITEGMVPSMRRW